VRVLYVDDDRVNSVLFCEIANLVPGTEVRVAGSAAEALELLGVPGETDVLVLDLHLPDGDGYQLLPQLRARAARRLPAYLCTADDPGQVADSAQAAGFDACWSKPLDLSLVLASLKQHAAAAGSGR
jgi:CheY-like chemotaxis protein